MWIWLQPDPRPGGDDQGAAPASFDQGKLAVCLGAKVSYEDAKFGDNNDLIAGPGRWNNGRSLRGTSRQDWGDQIDLDVSSA
jgi:hypothetical protein